MNPPDAHKTGSCYVYEQDSISRYNRAEHHRLTFPTSTKASKSISNNLTSLLPVRDLAVFPHNRFMCDPSVLGLGFHVSIHWL